MVVFSVKMTKAKISLALFCAVAVLITVTAIADSATRTQTVKSTAGATNNDRIEYLTSAGWEIVAEPLEIKEVTVPAEFDAVYTEYNNIQKSCGMDLSGYCGEILRQYRYRVVNYPDAGQREVVANLLVSDGRIVGGDISGVGTESFMHGLADFETVSAALAAMPAETE